MQLTLAGGGPDIVAHLIVKNDQSGSVALIVNREIEKRRGGKAGIVHLARPAWHRGVVHGIASVEQDGELAIGISAIALQVAALGAGKQIPIDVAQVVSGGVGAVL